MTETQTQLLATIAPIFMLVLVAERRSLFHRDDESRLWVWSITLAAFLLGAVTMISLINVDGGIPGERGRLVMHAGVFAMGMTIALMLILMLVESAKTKSRDR